MPEYILGVRGHDYGKGKIKDIFCHIKRDGWECTQLAFKKLVSGVTSYADVTPEVVAEVLAAIKEIQLEGKKRLNVKEFLRGFKYKNKPYSYYFDKIR